MMFDGVIAQIFAIAFLHVFPQCSVGIQVGQEVRWTGNGQEVGVEVLYRTIDRTGDKDERPDRDLALERRILAFRSRLYPQTRIFHAECVKRP